MLNRRFLITGGQLHGNLGAEAMAIVTIERIRDLFPDSKILFSAKYPRNEIVNVPKFFGATDAVRLIKASQIRATFIDLPILMFARLFRAQRLASQLSTVLKSFRESDFVVDIGGITFSEERGLSGLLINATWVLLPLLSGKPIVKLSQAFGPIKHTWFRIISKALLRRVNACIARGKLSRDEFDKLGLREKSQECADLAFQLKPEETESTQRIVKPKEGLVIGIAPSSVLYGKLHGQPYINIMAAVIEKLLHDYPDASVWIIAHSYREEDTLSNNDGPICRMIYESLAEEFRSRTRLIMGDYTPGETRTIVGKTDAFLACRFHAMISALAMGVPVAVLGWSHKYREVQAQFELNLCLDHKTASVDSICDLMRDIIRNRAVLKKKIVARLPGVLESSAKNFEILASFVKNKEKDTEKSTVRKALRAIEDVPTFGLCTGCGTCAGICPAGAITMFCNRKGLVVPQVNRETCTECGLCLQVCPGHELSFAQWTQEFFGNEPAHSALGHFRALYASHATNAELRKRTQSGGMISALLIFMLKQGMIDGAVVTRWKVDDPLETETVIATTPEEVLSAALSKYIPVPVNEIITELSRRKGRYAFVGTSCQIHGIRKAEALLPWLREKIALHIGLHCLGVFNKNFQNDMLARIGVERQELKHFIFRSKQPWGWPCHMHIETRDGRSWIIPGKYSRLAPRPYYTPYRCLLCFDKLNELADITFGDCRIPRHYGVKKLADAYRPDNLGKSDVIVRTKQGENALQAAIAHGVVKVEPSSPDEIKAPTKVIEKKLGVNNYSLNARIRGKPLPKYDVRFMPLSISRRFMFWFLSPLSFATSSILAFCCNMTGNRIFHGIMRHVPLKVLRLITGLLDKTTNFVAPTEIVITVLPRSRKKAVQINEQEILYT